MNSDGDAAKYREIREEDSYRASADALGDVAGVDNSLETVMSAVSSRPEGFHEVPGFPGIRIAITEGTDLKGLERAALRLWFRIVDHNVVALLYVDIDPYAEE